MATTEKIPAAVMMILAAVLALPRLPAMTRKMLKMAVTPPRESRRSGGRSGRRPGRRPVSSRRGGGRGKDVASAPKGKRARADAARAPTRPERRRRPPSAATAAPTAPSARQEWRKTEAFKAFASAKKPASQLQKLEADALKLDRACFNTLKMRALKVFEDIKAQRRTVAAAPPSTPPHDGAEERRLNGAAVSFAPSAAIEWPSAAPSVLNANTHTVTTQMRTPTAAAAPQPTEESFAVGSVRNRIDSPPQQTAQPGAKSPPALRPRKITFFEKMKPQDSPTFSQGAAFQGENPDSEDIVPSDVSDADEAHSPGECAAAAVVAHDSPGEDERETAAAAAVAGGGPGRGRGGRGRVSPGMGYRIGGRGNYIIEPIPPPRHRRKR
jgi:hypothetical protein